ncbi:endonuclease/exonuclease/phosphatase family protein [Photobacterium jeanii]|nr:endonuclease/exonuclease/phosphatase family protein [Photobacterium jeanii]
MSEPKAGAIFAKTQHTETFRFQQLAAIIQQVRPDILMLCEFDHPGNGGDDGALANFCQHYLGNAQGEQEAIEYPYCYLPATNTGLLSPVDLNGDGVLSLPEDGLGFGDHHGHYGFVILSRYPLEIDGARTWQQFLWRDMPNNKMPVDYYSEQAQQVLRLSSKNHLVLPVNINGKHLHLLCCHPTPPVFDGAEKRNARRNHDELRLVTDIINNADYLMDDAQQQGGLAPYTSFVVLGDLNADVQDGDGIKPAIKQLLHHPRIHREVSNGRLTPKSIGGRFARTWQARAGRPSEWTHMSGLRLDYVLPSADLSVTASGVFWPDRKDPLRALLLDDRGRERAQAGSDHRLVWVDITLNS